MNFLEYETFFATCIAALFFVLSWYCFQAIRESDALIRESDALIESSKALLAKSRPFTSERILLGMYFESNNGSEFQAEIEFADIESAINHHDHLKNNEGRICIIKYQDGVAEWVVKPLGFGFEGDDSQSTPQNMRVITAFL